MAGKGYQDYYDAFESATAGKTAAETALLEKSLMHKTPPVEMKAAYRNLITTKQEIEANNIVIAKLSDLSKYNIRENEKGVIELLPKVTEVRIAP